MSPSGISTIATAKEIAETVRNQDFYKEAGFTYAVYTFREIYRLYEVIEKAFCNRNPEELCVLVYMNSEHPEKKDKLPVNGGFVEVFYEFPKSKV